MYLGLQSPVELSGINGLADELMQVKVCATYWVGLERKLPQDY